MLDHTINLIPQVVAQVCLCFLETRNFPTSKLIFPCKVLALVDPKKKKKKIVIQTEENNRKCNN